MFHTNVHGKLITFCTEITMSESESQFKMSSIDKDIHVT